MKRYTAHAHAIEWHNDGDNDDGRQKTITTIVDDDKNVSKHRGKRTKYRIRNSSKAD